MLSYEQWCEEVIPALRTWERITYEQGYDHPLTSVNAFKSRLLYRMIVEGKEPLPTPPPLNHAAPWYELVERGRAGLPKMMASRWANPDRANYWNICGDNRWTELGATRVVEIDGKPVDPKVFEQPGADASQLISLATLEHPNLTGELWVIRRPTPDDKETCGQRLMTEGYRVPLPCAWILERIERETNGR